MASISLNIPPAIYEEAPAGLSWAPESDVIPITESIKAVFGGVTSIRYLEVESMFVTAQQELNSYRDFRKGWDGYEGEVFSSSTVDIAIDLLVQSFAHFQTSQVYLKEITPCPVSDGSVDIEISDGNKKLILNVSDEGRTLGVYRKDEADIFEDSVLFSTARVESELEWLAGTSLGEVQLA